MNGNYRKDIKIGSTVTGVEKQNCFYVNKVDILSFIVL